MRHRQAASVRAYEDDSEDVAQARAGLQDEGTYADLAELFGAIADATRAKIVHTLLRQELCTRDIASVAGITESGASQHLRVLRSLRLVKSRRAGKFVYYSLDDAHIALLVQVGLTHLGHEQALVGQERTASSNAQVS